MHTNQETAWCDRHIQGEWDFDDSGQVSVPGNLTFKDKSFTHFPIHFAPIQGNFDCSDCLNLVSLEGAPQRVEGSCYLNNCIHLTSLRGGPTWVGKDLDCILCTRLESLEGAPIFIGGTLNCFYCSRLLSLSGAPEKIPGDFLIHGCLGPPTLQNDSKIVESLKVGK